MLRLRPSELTLTSEDVEETFRRMARKQALKASRHASSQPSTLPARVTLRQGAQRSVRDSITTLGDIPVLRPQPQQALQAFVDEDIGGASDQATPSLQRVESVSGSLPRTQSDQEARAPVDASRSPPSRTLHLPFRHRRGRSDSAQPTQTEPQTEQRDTSPPHLPQLTASSTEQVTTPGESSRSPLGMRGGGDSSRKGKGAADQTLQHKSTSPNKEKEDSSSEEGEYGWMTKNINPNEPPPLFLSGDWTGDINPTNPMYAFRELDLVYEHPQTEPRRRPERDVLPARSHSVGNAPPSYNPAAHHGILYSMNPMFGGHMYNTSGSGPFLQNMPSTGHLSHTAYAPAFGTNYPSTNSYHPYTGPPGSASSNPDGSHYPQLTPPHMQGHAFNTPEFAVAPANAYGSLGGLQPPQRPGYGIDFSRQYPSAYVSPYVSQTGVSHDDPRGLQPPQQTISRPGSANIQLNSSTAPRHSSSEASAASGAFSFYELPPGSRHPSGEQHHGILASMPGGRGRYYPSHPSGLQATGTSRQSSSTNTGHGNQHGPSPLPSMPYSNAQTTPPVTHRSGSRSGHAMDAATAAVQDLPSPLDTYSNHYQHHVRNQNSRHTMQTQPPNPMWPTGDLIARPPQPNAREHRSAPSGPRPRNSLFDEPEPRNQRSAPAERQARQTSSLSEEYDPYGPNARNQRNARSERQRLQRGSFSDEYDPYGPNARNQRVAPPEPLSSEPFDPFRPSDGPRPGMRGGSAEQTVQALRRNAQTTRAEQRSSENMPVRPTAQNFGPSRNSQVQLHRAAFERLHNTRLQTTTQESNQRTTELSRQASDRLSVPQPPGPRDASNRPRSQGAHTGPPRSMDRIRQRMQQNSSSPLPIEIHRIPAADMAARAHAPGTSLSVPPSTAPSLPTTDAPTRTYTRTRRRATPVPPALATHPTRDLPSISLALEHATSVRSPIARALTLARQHRRVPPRQREQENLGVEEAAMRLEVDAVLARYGVEEQRSGVMDVTPPRVGRVERRMGGL
ncbi:hypothetical protein CC86DRAFT_402891 [Ophiobolus disseminans]|uniref:Uncharacterized protein n=1 Tax=Ophiobolus disseminans TaxID=1469910 RepID=A0A6A7ACC5_9PLEO|nr:hypothetical protein CC86DRAFT_402891 [Ophiobolus disseminans]